MTSDPDRALAEADLSTTHRYRSRLSWQGSTLDGYASYGRAHTMQLPPAAAELALSSDPAFNGDPALANPEQLLLAAASSCQLLSFLAVAARARIEVLSYEDHAEAVMPEDRRPMRITQITLSPRIVLGPGTDLQRIPRLVEIAHKECFVANSLDVEMIINPVVELGGEA